MARKILLHWLKGQLEILKMGVVVVVGIPVCGALMSFAGIDDTTFFPNLSITNLLEWVAACCVSVTITEVFNLVSCRVIAKRINASYAEVWAVFNLYGESKYIFLMYPGEFRRILAITEESLAAP